MFGSTARSRRGPTISARTQSAVTRAVGQQMQRAGLGALRSLAGSVAADVTADILGEVGRIRRGGVPAALGAIGRGVLGGVGRAISWLLGGQRGASGASPADVRAAREIVAKVRSELPGPITQPGTARPEESPAPSPSSTGRGRFDQGGGGGRIGGTGRGGGAGDGGYRGRGGPDMIPVNNSSNVHSFGYDAFQATLYVTYLGVVLRPSKVKLGSSKASEFKNSPLTQYIKVKKGAHTGERAGPGATYAYFGVPQSVFTRMRAAASKGIFIWDEIRVRGTIYGHRYRYRLATPGRARVPGAMDPGHDTISYVPRRATKTGLRQRSITVASGQTIYSNMSKYTGRRAPFRNR